MGPFEHEVPSGSRCRITRDESFFVIVADVVVWVSKGHHSFFTKLATGTNCLYCIFCTECSVPCVWFSIRNEDDAVLLESDGALLKS